MSLPRICAITIGILTTCWQSATISAESVVPQAAHTTCQCRDGTWQWVTEVVRAGGTTEEFVLIDPGMLQRTAASQQSSVAEFKIHRRSNEAFDGSYFQLTGPGDSLAATGDPDSQPQARQDEEADLPQRAGIQVALRDGQLIDLFGKPIRITADGMVANAPLFGAAALRLEGPNSGGRYDALPAHEAHSTNDTTMIGGAHDGPEIANHLFNGRGHWKSSIGGTSRIALGLRDPFSNLSASADRDLAIGGQNTNGPRVSASTSNGSDPSARLDQAGRATSGAQSSKNPATRGANDRADRNSPGDWSVLPGESGGGAPAILGGVPGQGSFSSSPPSSGSSGGRGIGGSPLSLGSPGGGGTGIPSSGGGGGSGEERPAEPPDTPPLESTIQPQFTPADGPPVVFIPEIPVPEIPLIVSQIPLDEIDPAADHPAGGSPGDTPVVPEPGSLLLLALGGGIGAAARYRRRRRTLRRPAI